MCSHVGPGHIQSYNQNIISQKSPSIEDRLHNRIWNDTCFPQPSSCSLANKGPTTYIGITYMQPCKEKEMRGRAGQRGEMHFHRKSEFLVIGSFPSRSSLHLGWGARRPTLHEITKSVHANHHAFSFLLHNCTFI